MNFGKSTAIFDLDGTLLNSTYLWSEIDEEFLGKRGYSVPQDYVANIAHMSLDEVAIYTKNFFNLTENTQEIIAEWKTMAKCIYDEKIMLKEGAKEYIEKLYNANIKLCVATGLPHSLFEKMLERLEISKYFQVKFSVDDVKEGKGSPLIYIHTAKEVGSSISDCVVYEDVLQAMKSAKKAGMEVCAVYDENSKNQDDIKDFADYYIKSWSELF